MSKLGNRSMNKSISTQVKPITLSGSATIVVQFFKYAVNSILYQRGVYAPGTFDRKEEYGITLFVSKDPEILTYFDNILPNLEAWLAKGELKGLSLVIISTLTGETLEKWDFEINTVAQDGDVTITGRVREYGKKELCEIQKGIRNVMRQITATVTFLPLLDTRCSFDLRIVLTKKATVSKEWNEENETTISNPEIVQLRSFSTSVHRVQASVTYKGD